MIDRVGAYDEAYRESRRGGGKGGVERRRAGLKLESGRIDRDGRAARAHDACALESEIGGRGDIHGAMGDQIALARERNPLKPGQTVATLIELERCARERETPRARSRARGAGRGIIGKRYRSRGQLG